MSDVPPAKRRKLGQAPAAAASGTSEASTSLSRPVSPPSPRRSTPVQAAVPLQAFTPTWSFDDVPKPALTAENDGSSTRNVVQYVASPFQLTSIRDLAPHQNVDTVVLRDILGDPMIKECWNFNFLFDLDFVMQQFDEDVRDSVKVKIVHGFWKRDDERRIDLMETAERYPNVDLVSAYLPDPFGTHHSKMLILFRHDDCAQVIIHTANMIPKDWMNMTQAVWRSLRLPLKSGVGSTEGPFAIGTGNRFYVDLRRYLLSYEKRLQRLVDQLSLYDFLEIRAAFLGSAPSRQIISQSDSRSRTSFGWLGLQDILSSVPNKVYKDPQKPPHIVLQVSSIATLGAVPTWLSHFQSVLARSRTQIPLPQTKPKYNIIFPTAEEVRTSLDGYESGGSIHMRVQSAQQQKQLQYIHPVLCHWKRLSTAAPAPSAEHTKDAHRGSAAPHIKTYIRFSDYSHSSIDWALLTSANLSKQAWGDVVNKQGEVRIQSYETGVLLWPELFASCETGCQVSMVPTFGRDMPILEDALAEPQSHGQNSEGAHVHEDDEETEEEDNGRVSDDDETEDETEHVSDQVLPLKSKQDKVTDKGEMPLQVPDNKCIVVGLRMPYDLPLSPYGVKDIPWCATQQYTKPDWKGRAWGGY